MSKLNNWIIRRENIAARIERITVHHRNRWDDNAFANIERLKKEQRKLDRLITQEMERRSS